jgi:transcription elongation factor/antiterminator RfaH
MKRQQDLLSETGGAKDPRWYVVQSRPHKELYAASNLERQGFHPFVPQLRKTVRHARRTRTILAPLFPRYLFVSLDLSRDRWRSVRGTFGVSCMVMDGDRPRPAPRGLVEQIIASTNGADAVNFRDRLALGQNVRFLSGPFAEKIGRLVSLDEAGRVAVLLEIFGADRQIAVAPEILMPVAV